MKDNELVIRMTTIILLAVMIVNVLNNYYDSRVISKYIDNNYEQITTDSGEILWKKIKR